MKQREYRVVVRREGQRPKVNRYARREFAEQRLRLVTSSEPWRVLWPGRDPDELWCCSGHECACGAVTLREYAAKERTNLPPLISAEIQYREVGEWRSVTADD